MLPISPNSCRSLFGTRHGVPDNDADALNAAITTTTGMIMNFIVLRGRLFAGFHYRVFRRGNYPALAMDVGRGFFTLSLSLPPLSRYIHVKWRNRYGDPRDDRVENRVSARGGRSRAKLQGRQSRDVGFAVAVKGIIPRDL